MTICTAVKLGDVVDDAPLIVTPLSAMAPAFSIDSAVVLAFNVTLDPMMPELFSIWSAVVGRSVLVSPLIVSPVMS